MFQFILVGAGTRVPKVQEVLHKKISMELSKNINADEAATLGAAYRAADLSKGFKVKQFHVRDAVLFPIQVSILLFYSIINNNNLNLLLLYRKFSMC